MFLQLRPAVLSFLSFFNITCQLHDLASHGRGGDCASKRATFAQAICKNPSVVERCEGQPCKSVCQAHMVVGSWEERAPAVQEGFIISPIHAPTPSCLAMMQCVPPAVVLPKQRRFARHLNPIEWLTAACAKPQYAETLLHPNLHHHSCRGLIQWNSCLRLPFQSAPIWLSAQLKAWVCVCYS